MTTTQDHLDTTRETIKEGTAPNGKACRVIVITKGHASGEPGKQGVRVEMVDDPDKAMLYTIDKLDSILAMVK